MLARGGRAPPASIPAERIALVSPASCDPDTRVKKASSDTTFGGLAPGLND